MKLRANDISIITIKHSKNVFAKTEFKLVVLGQKDSVHVETNHAETAF